MLDVGRAFHQMECFHQIVKSVQRHYHSILCVASGDHREVSVINNLVNDLFELISRLRKLITRIKPPASSVQAAVQACGSCTEFISYECKNHPKVVFVHRGGPGLNRTTRIRIFNPGTGRDLMPSRGGG